MCLHVEIGKERLVTHDIHGRQENDGDVVETAIRPDPLHDVQAVHDRHVIIKNDGVDRKTHRYGFLQHGNAGGPSLDGMAVYAPAL